MSRGFTITESTARRIAQALRTADLTRKPQPTWRDGAPRFCWVSGSSALAANRWTYQIVPADDPTQTLTAYNWMERVNTASIAGPGIDAADLPGTFAVLPIGKDKDAASVLCGVTAWYIRVNSVLAWWFCAENLADGTCDSVGVGGGYPEELGYAGL